MLYVYSTRYVYTLRDVPWMIIRSDNEACMILTLSRIAERMNEKLCFLWCINCCSLTSLDVNKLSLFRIERYSNYHLIRQYENTFVSFKFLIMTLSLSLLSFAIFFFLRKLFKYENTAIEMRLIVMCVN